MFQQMYVIKFKIHTILSLTLEVDTCVYMYMLYNYNKYI